MEKLLSVAQVSEFLGVHPKTLYRLIRDNRIALRYIRTKGRTIMFRPSDIEDFVIQREVQLDGSRKRRKPKKPAGVYSETAGKSFTTKELKNLAMTNEEAQRFFEGLETDDVEPPKNAGSATVNN